MPKKKSTFQLKDQEGNPIEIPIEGSLGLLAFGYQGVMLWRQKKKEHLEKVLKEKIAEDNARSLP